MIASAIVLLAITQSRPDIVCTARFFKPGAEKSYYHLYQCRFDGSHRKQLTFGKKLQMAPCWLDHHNLAYAELDRPPFSDGSRSGIHHKARINVLNVKTNRVKTLVEVQGTDIYADCDPDDNTYRLGDTIFKVSINGAKKITPPKQQPNDPGQYKEQDDGTWSAIIPSPSENPHWNVNCKEAKSTYIAPNSGFEYPDVEATIESVGTYSLHGSMVRDVQVAGKDRLYVVTQVSANRVDHDSFVYEIDCKAKKKKLILSKVGDMMLDAEAGYWVGRQADARPMVKISGSGSEWANFLYSGDIKSGKRWTLFDGLVDAGEYSLRP